MDPLIILPENLSIPMEYLLMVLSGGPPSSPAGDKSAEIMKLREELFWELHFWE
jgi:hypothetical protein